jgi:hypothetical protein
MVRVYFNRRGPLPWSLDYGSQQTEVNVAHITINSTIGYTMTDPHNTDPEKPSGWIEFPDAAMRIDEGTALVLPAL